MELTSLFPPTLPRAEAPTPNPKEVAPLIAFPPIWVAVDNAWP